MVVELSCSQVAKPEMLDMLAPTSEHRTSAPRCLTLCPRQLPARASACRFESIGVEINTADTYLSFLPLAHIYGRKPLPSPLALCIS